MKVCSTGKSGRTLYAQQPVSLRIFTSLPGSRLRFNIAMQIQYSYYHSTSLYNGINTKALHGRLAGRFKPPLAGRCNDFAPSRQKNCHRQKTTVPSRPSKKKKKHRPVPSRRKKKKGNPVPPRKKKTTAPSRLGKKKKPPRPASKKNKPAPSHHEQQNTPPRGWKLETNTTACLFFSLSCCTFISYCSLVRSVF